jgi:hypothetical protein
MDLFLFAQCLRDRGRQLEPDLTPGSSWNIHLYTNELGIAIGSPATAGISTARPYSDQAE